MSRFRLYTAVLFLAVFVVSVTGGIALACDGHKKAKEETASLTSHCDMESMASKHTSDSADTPSCDNCVASSCGLQSLFIVDDTSSLFLTSASLEAKDSIDLKSIYLQRIPDPPQPIS